MHEFRVYKHPTDRLEAVKEGWSWPGFFLACFWALYKKLWLYGGGALGISLVLHTVMPFSGLPFLFDFACCVAFGYLGNGWYEGGLADRGFDLVDTVEAKTPEGAIAEHLRIAQQGETEGGRLERAEPSL